MRPETEEKEAKRALDEIQGSSRAEPTPEALSPKRRAKRSEDCIETSITRLSRDTLGMTFTALTLMHTIAYVL